MSDGKVDAALDEIRERYSKAAPGVSSNPVLYMDSADDVPRLLAALDEVLKLADWWDANPSVTYQHMALGLRATVARGLLGEDGSDA